MVFQNYLNRFFTYFIQFLVLLKQSKQDQEPISALSLWIVSARQALLPVPHCIISKQDQVSLSVPAKTVSAKKAPLPGQVAVCRHRTAKHNPNLVNPESFIEASLSAGALLGGVTKK